MADEYNMIFTVEEENLLCIFITPLSRLGGNPGDVSSRDALIDGVRAAMPDMDEPEMREIAESALRKLDAMTDAEFDALEFYPAYYDDTPVLPSADGDYQRRFAVETEA